MTRATTFPDALLDSKRRISPPKVLCIDDDPEISRVIQIRLSNFEVRVERAFHGMQGYWLAVTENPNVIITDLSMPRGEGEYVLECLKRNEATAGIPVIVLTGLRAEDLPGRLSSCGAAAFLRKPCRFDDLIAELSRHIELRQRDFSVEQEE